MAQPIGVPSDGISWNWRDVSKDEDSVPSYSGQQEPLSQQAVMLSMADVIRQENIKYVGIAATDIFDILFIRKFLKLAAPNTRLFVLDADVLMVRTSAEGRELDGTLAVTTYPLFARNDDWTQGSAPSERLSEKDMLPSRVAEGVYNAVLFELDPNKRGARREYTNPIKAGSDNDRPPLWLTIVGRNGFWPISLQDSDPAQEAPTRGPSPTLARVRERLTFDPPDGATLLLEGGLLVWATIHLLGMCLSTKSGYLWLRQFQFRGAHSRQFHAQLLDLLGGAGPAKGIADANSIGFGTKGEGINSFESDEHDATLGSPSLGDVSVAFVGSANKPNPTMSSNIQAILDLNHAAVSPLNVISRIKTQTCAGCHHFSDPS